MAQRCPERFVAVNPLRHASDEPGWKGATAMDAWIDFAGYISSTDGQHGWMQRLGVVAELARSDKTDIYFLSDMELISDRYNEIRFNPRAIFWEEALVVGRETRMGTLQIGYYHRCKHDVDNLSSEQERTLIYGGLRFSLVQDRGGRIFKPYVEITTLRQDFRLGEDLGGRSTNTLQGSIGGLLQYTKPWNDRRFSWFGDSYVQLSSFGNREGFFSRYNALSKIRIDRGVRIGVSFSGAALIKFGITYEYIGDTAITLKPESGHHVLAGLTVSDGVSIK